jgi:glycosyltransferase involved in cell wall biosynthesis
VTTSIGYVAKIFPRLSETFVLNEIRQLERDETRVHVFSLHAPPADVPHRALRELRAEVTCVEATPDPHEEHLRRATMAARARLATDGIDGDRLAPRKYVRLALQLVEAARGLGLGRLHAHFASRAAHVAMLAAPILGVPFSFTAHAKDIFHEEVDRDLLRVKMREADRIATVTDYNRRVLLEIGADLPLLERKTMRIYNGVDLTLFRVQAAAPAAPRILGVGRLVEKKGFPVLVDACARLRASGVPFACDIVGAGAQEALLRATIEASHLGDAITLRGALPLEAVAETMRAATVVVLPCIRAADGNVDALPTVLLEAMATGVPVVSTRLSGIPEIIVDGETGFLVPPGDPGALADALDRLLADPTHAFDMGRAARARAERLFDLRKNVRTLRTWLTAAEPTAIAG